MHTEREREKKYRKQKTQTTVKDRQDERGRELKKKNLGHAKRNKENCCTALGYGCTIRFAHVNNTWPTGTAIRLQSNMILTGCLMSLLYRAAVQDCGELGD